MKTINEIRSRNYWKLSFGLATLVLIVFETAVAQTRYTVKDLGTLGGKNSIPYRINNRGQVVGVAETSEPDPNSSGALISHAFVWQEGEEGMQDLGTLTANSKDWNSLANNLNNRGDVVGWSNTGAFDPITHSPEIRAFVWHEGEMTNLGTLGGNNSAAAGINDRDQVAGTSEIPTVDPTFPPFLELRGFLWEKGVMKDLDPLGAGNNSVGNDINERTEIAGGSDINTIKDPLLGFPAFHSALWKKGVVSQLNLQELHGSIAFAINNRGQVVGRFAADENGVPISHAYLWKKSMTHDLGTLSGLQDSEAQNLNGQGQIVGDSGTGPIETFSPVAAWLLENGVTTDLNTLIPANSGFHLIVAFDINAQGQIVACGVESNGNIHAVLLNPREEDDDDKSAGQAGASSTRENVTLSENARKLLVRGKTGLGLSGTGVTRP